MAHTIPKLEGRRSEIAAAARSLIAERGFEGLRTRDIAARVGINVATLHYHVPTKQALVQLVAQSLRADFIEQNLAHPRDGLSPLARLKLEMAEFRATIAEDPERLDVLAELAIRAGRDAEVAAEIEPMQAFWHGQIASVIEAGRQEGDFRPDVDPPAAATMVIGTMTMARRSAQSLDAFDLACAELLRALSVPPSRPEG